MAPKVIARLQYLTQDIAGTTHARLAEQACLGGVRWIQLRIKELSADAALQEAIAVKKITDQYGATLIINDHVWISREINAHGVHLGKSDMDVSEARAILGEQAIIGGTANTPEDILHLVEKGVDYIGLGPFRHTTTKKNLSPVLGMEGYRQIMGEISANGLHVPVIAIGGIQLPDLALLAHTGIYGIAVSSAMHASGDITDNARPWLNEIDHFQQEQTAHATDR